MRLIDADALIAEWYKLNNIGPEDCGARFVGYQEIARLINNAPTVSGHGDYISRADAIDAVMKHKMPFSIQQEMAREIDALPSAEAEQVTSKLKKPCDSLLKDDSAECKEQKCKLESADAVHGEWLYVENEPYSECSKCGRYIDDLDEDKYAYCPYCGARMKNDVIESQNDVIKKPRTVRYKLHKPIEYVSIEFDEEETITHIDHYTAYGERREPK